MGSRRSPQLRALYMDVPVSVHPFARPSNKHLLSAGCVAGTEDQGTRCPACAELTMWCGRQTGHPCDVVTCRELHVLIGVHLCLTPKVSVSLGFVLTSSLSGAEDALRKHLKQEVIDQVDS